MANDVDIVSRMSKDLALEIFGFLDIETLGRACRTSKGWKQLASDNRVWKKVFPENNLLPMPQGENIKGFLDKHAVGSKAQIVERHKEFLKTVLRDRHATFTCLFPFNPQCFVNTELESKMNNHETQKVKKVCVFIKKLDESCLESGSTTQEAPDFNFRFKTSCKLRVPFVENNNNDIAGLGKLQKDLAERVKELTPGFFDNLLNLVGLA